MVVYVYMIMTTLYAVQSMVRRIEKVLGSRSRPIKSNKDDLIVINDAEVNYMYLFCHLINLYNILYTEVSNI